jgi:hypothetical protein
MPFLSLVCFQLLALTTRTTLLLSKRYCTKRDIKNFEQKTAMRNAKNLMDVFCGFKHLKTTYMLLRLNAKKYLLIISFPRTLKVELLLKFVSVNFDKYSFIV